MLRRRRAVLLAVNVTGRTVADGRGNRDLVTEFRGYQWQRAIRQMEFESAARFAGTLSTADYEAWLFDFGTGRDGVERGRYIGTEYLRRCSTLRRLYSTTEFPGPKRGEFNPSWRLQS